MTIAMRHVVKFPANVQATKGVDVTRANGTYTFKLNYENLTPAATVASNVNVAFQDPATGAMGVTTLASALNSNANIQAIANTETGIDKLGYWNGTSVYALTDFPAYARGLISSDSASAARVALGTVIGTDVQAHSASLDGFAGKTVPTGNVVGSSDTQTLTNKTIDGDSNTLTNVPSSAVTGLSTVATSGAYGDLSGLPTLGDLAAKDQAAIADINATGTPSSTTALFGDGTWKTPAGGGDMVAANNLSDLTDSEAALRNLSFLQSGTGAVARPAVLKMRDVLSLWDFNCVADASTDNATKIDEAIAECISRKIPLLIPASGQPFLTSSTADITGIPGIYGEGAHSQLITSSNVPFFSWDRDSAQCYGVVFRDFSLLGNVSGTRTSNMGFQFYGTSAANYVAYSKFLNLMFFGLYLGIDFDNALTGTSGESHVDWNSFVNLITSNYGANPTNRAVRFQNGSGTGNSFNGGKLVTNDVGIDFDTGNSMNVGDILIGGVQFAGSGTGIRANATTGVYGANLSISNCQFDGGNATSLDFTNMGNFKAVGCNWGGATSRTLTNCDSYYIEGAGGNDNQVQSTGAAAPDYIIRTSSRPTGGGEMIQEESLLNSKTGLAAGATVEMHRVYIAAYKGCTIDIVSAGLQQGVGAGVAASKFYLYNDGSAIHATSISNGDNNLTNTVDVSNSAYASIKVVLSGTLGDNHLTTSVKAVGTQSYVRRM